MAGPGHEGIDDGRGEAGAGRRAVPAPVSAAPEPPPEAVAVFGDRLPQARRYADLLATTGIAHGLIGPREAARLWERHLVNCAVLQTLLDPGSTVIDIGSGAGLPGVVLAVARPDLHVHLVEPLLRRTTWLQTAVDELGLDNVVVHRGRAEEMADLTAPVVTARAVAALDKLVAWGFPLLPAEGRLLALKGAAAADELATLSPTLTAMGVTQSRVHVLGEGVISEPVRVVEIVRPDVVIPAAELARAGRRGSTRPRRVARGRRGRRQA